MPEQFVNPEEAEVKDETATDEAAEKRIDRVAEKAAEKASHTVKNFDKDHTIISH